MCLFFHKWSKWGELREEKWAFQYYADMVSCLDYDYIKVIQSRVCEKCGKYQESVINEYRVKG
jgi:hypothetical protein